MIDVGFSGVIGAERIATGQQPVRQLPDRGHPAACGPADSSGEIRDRIQTNGRCEAADAQGDTYGPVSYEAYLPGYLAFGWSGKWDTLPAAHATSILWDLLCLLGLWLVGLRFGGRDSGRRSRSRGSAWPFSQYASNSNTNDMIQPALLLFGFYFLAPPVLRGAFGMLGALVKFSPLVVLPLWSGYPDSRDNRSRRRSSSARSSRRRRRSRSSCSTRAPCTRRRSSSTTRSATSSGAPRRSRSGTGGSTTRRGCPTCTGAERPPGGARRRRARALPLAAPPHAAADGGVHRRAARRVRDRADALVVALPASGSSRSSRSRCCRRARRRRRRGRPASRADELAPAAALAERSGADSLVDSRNADASSQLRRAGRRPPHSTSTPSIRTSPLATSSRDGKPVVKRRIGPSGRLPMTESCGPVIPASVTAAVPPASTRASFVCTWVWVPSTAVARPSR